MDPYSGYGYYPRSYFQDTSPGPIATGPVYQPTTVKPVPVSSGSGTTLSSNTGCGYTFIGYLLIILSIASFGVGIGSIYYTVTNCSKSSALPYVLTWLGVGIWASIPVFITGILAARLRKTNYTHIRMFALFSFLSTFVFTPAMMGINVAEVIMFSTDLGNINPAPSCSYTFNSGTGTFSQSIKFYLPTVDAVLGSLEFYLLLVTSFYLCCCVKKSALAPTVANVAPQPVPAIAPPMPVPYPVYAQSPLPAMRPSYANTGFFGGGGGVYGSSYYGASANPYNRSLPALPGIGNAMPNPAYRIMIV